MSACCHMIDAILQAVYIEIFLLDNLVNDVALCLCAMSVVALIQGV